MTKATYRNKELTEEIKCHFVSVFLWRFLPLPPQTSKCNQTNKILQILPLLPQGKKKKIKKPPQDSAREDLYIDSDGAWDVFLCALLFLSTHYHGRGVAEEKAKNFIFFSLTVTLLQHLLKPFVPWGMTAPQTQGITEEQPGGVPLTYTTGSRNLLSFWPSSQATLTLRPEQSFNPVFLPGSVSASPTPPFLWYNWDCNPSPTAVSVATEVQENLQCARWTA